MSTATHSDLAAYCREAAGRAKAAAAALALVRGEQKNAWLRQSAARLREQTAQLLAANADDIAAAPGFGLSEAAIDRLRLNPQRIEEIGRLAGQRDTHGRETGRPAAEAQMLFSVHIFARSRVIPSAAPISTSEDSRRPPRP